MKHYILYIVLLFISTVNASYNDSLSVNQKKLQDSIQTAFVMKSCQHITLNQALKNKNCKLAPRLNEFLSWMIFIEKDRSKIEKELNIRQDFFFSTKTFDLNTSLYSSAGNITSPIKIAVYMSGSCPLCKKVIGELYKEVTEGQLLNKAVLYPIPFGVNIADKALLVAKEFGVFWQFFNELKNKKERLSESQILEIAKKLDLPTDKFKKMLYDKEIKNKLIISYNEAVKNKVRVTPTFFINNHRYHSYKNPEWIVDAVLYNFETLQKNNYKK